MAATKSQYQVRALERALQILESFTLDKPEMSLSEIAAAVNLAPSTAVRLLSILLDYGYVERASDTDRYRLGVSVFERGSIYIQTTSIETEASEPLAELARQSNLTASLAVLDRGEIVHIAVIPPRRAIRYFAPIGQREMAHCTGLGKVLLSGLSDEALEDVVSLRGLAGRTDRTITALDGLRTELERIRASGYAIDNEESLVGLKCVAAPIFNDRNRMVAAISASGPEANVTDQTLPELLRLVKQAASAVSARLGHDVQRNGQQP